MIKFDDYVLRHYGQLTCNEIPRPEKQYAIQNRGKGGAGLCSVYAIICKVAPWDQDEQRK